jgi:hypothetical protein
MDIADTADTVDTTKILGAGSFGIVLTNNSDKAYKVFYDIYTYNDIVTETNIQKKAYNLLKDIVNVPYIYNTYRHFMTYKSKEHLFGIEMDKVPIPDQFENQVHIVLGYSADDIDSVWSRDYRNPVSENNPPRGFYAGHEMMEAIWQDENIDMTIDDVAYKMGLAYNILITNGIIPYDVEWIYGGNGNIYLIDFGLCKEYIMSKKAFLEGTSSQSIAIDYYVPKKGFKGYEAFLKGYNEII